MHGIDEQPFTPPRAHILDSAPPKESDRLAAIVVLTTSSGFPWLISNDLDRVGGR